MTKIRDLYGKNKRGLYGTNKRDSQLVKIRDFMTKVSDLYSKVYESCVKAIYTNKSIIVLSNL